MGALMMGLLIISISHQAFIPDSFGIISTNVNPNNSTVLTGYVLCLMNQTTNDCKDCPPNCITFKSNNVVVSNNDLASEIGAIYEKSLRQISIIKSSDINTNHTKTAIIYLQSMFLKNQIKSHELSLIASIFSKINQTNSTTNLGKNLHVSLDSLNQDNSSSPIAISIVGLLSKNVDLLINSDSIIHKIGHYPNLPYDLDEQKEWLKSILIYTILGCEFAGPLGCLLSSIHGSEIV